MRAPRLLSRLLPRLLSGLFLLSFLAFLAGCAGLPPQPRERTLSVMLPAEPDAPLAQVAAEAGLPKEQSGFWPMAEADFALDARVTLIRKARRSLDLQYYLVGNDTIGRLILRELRDAAARGVRVRLLVDDLYTQGLDPLLLGLAAHDNVEVRLFNPFVSGREWSLGRFAGFVGDFRRLNHRMHNKLFIADGAMAVAGGRNLADEYFLRSKDANFLDLDMLIAGPLVHRLGELFDRYWNSEQVFPVEEIAASALDRKGLRDDFEDRTSGPTDPATLPPSGLDVYGAPTFSTQLAQHQYRFVVAPAGAVADLPAKASTDAQIEFETTVTYAFLSRLREARKEVLLFSPYFIPGEKGIARLKEARDHGIDVRIVTNALGTSDEPLVNLSYQRYRRQMLGMGIHLYEMSASRLTHDPWLKRALGSSRGRLHAKLAFVDRETVLIGSMNMDPRSAYTNTEIGIAIRAPQLAAMVLKGFKVDANAAAVYEIRLKPDGSTVEWVGHDDSGEEVLGDEPDITMWQRLKLWMLHLFVPEDLL